MTEMRQDENQQQAPPETEAMEAELLDEEAELPEPEGEGQDEEMSLEEALGKMAKAYAEMEQQKAEVDNQLLRMQADFDNFRKRTRTEKEEWRTQIIADFCGDILPVIDNFDRAMQAMAQAGGADQHLAGVQMIARQLSEILVNKGVERIPTVGEEFDPKWHEAIGQAPVEEEDQIGKVVDEVQAGYRVGEKLIRVAMVRVGAKA